ncbi:MAG: hypothetical protein AB1918_06080, partial [Pseudomonadota bacterium]
MGAPRLKVNLTKPMVAPARVLEYPGRAPQAAPAVMHKAPATGLVDLPADQLTDLLDDILAGETAEEETAPPCPEPSSQPRTVEEAFARIHPLASNLLGGTLAEAVPEEEEPLLLDAALEVPAEPPPPAEPAPEEPEPL